MKNKLFAAAFAALALGAATPALADHNDRYRDTGYHDGYRDRDYRDDYRDDDFRRGERWRQMGINVRVNGRQFSVNHGDRLFYRLLDRPYGFRPGLTYAYTDRCNRFGCVVFVYDDYRRRPVDRIFAPHLPMRNYAWRDDRRFDSDYRGYGRYNRDDRRFDDQWRYDDDYRWSERDRRWNDFLEGGRDPR